MSVLSNRNYNEHIHNCLIIAIDNFYRPADKVIIGNEVLVQENHELTPTLVTNISNSKEQGNNFSETYETVYCFHDIFQTTKKN